MLDQNTDRMWYVIGAVIVGAAIILILNGTAPEIFASVADTFKGKTDETTDVVDSLTMTDGENLMPFASDDWQEMTIATTATNVMAFETLDSLGLQVGDTITFSGVYDYGKYALAPRFMFSPVPRETDDKDEMNDFSSTYYTGTGKFEYSTVIPERSKYLTLRLHNGNHNGQGGEFNVKVKHLKLERGAIATEY